MTYFDGVPQSNGSAAKFINQDFGLSLENLPQSERVEYFITLAAREINAGVENTECPGSLKSP